MQQMATQRAAFSSGTLSNLAFQWRKFQKFTKLVGDIQLPVSVADLCIYIQFLANELRSPQAVRNYLNGLRVLHSLAGMSTDSFYTMDVRLLMLGVKRLKKHVVRQAEPITVQMLLKIQQHVNMQDVTHVVSWTAILVAFFCMLRSSNLVPKSRHGFDPDKQLCRGDFLYGDGCMVVKIRWSKTIQFANRVYYLPLVSIQDSPLCPVQAVLQLRHVQRNTSSPAFFSIPSRKKWVPLTYAMLLRQFKGWIKQIGYDPRRFSLHSLRRGSATLAFEMGLPAEFIKAQGDWASDAYLRYINISLPQRCQVAETLSQQVRLSLQSSSCVLNQQ